MRVSVYVVGWWSGWQNGNGNWNGNGGSMTTGVSFFLVVSSFLLLFTSTFVYGNTAYMYCLLVSLDVCV